VDADPSGWLLAYSQSEDLIIFPKVNRHDFARYYLDYGSGLSPYKEHLSSLLSAWEGNEVKPDDFTLCPSGALGSLITLGALRAQGIKRVLFETPCYYGTLEQAEEMGFEVERIPTYRRDRYELPDVTKMLRSGSRSVLWLTQPRVALGWNQSIDVLLRVLEDLDRRDFLVIDEVTDQSYPAHLGPLRVLSPDANLVRLRSFTKAMGLNGFRLSAILHPRRLRKSFTEALELFGGTLDAHSVLTVDALSQNAGHLESMLLAASRQVNDLRAKTQRLTRKSAITVNPLVNGYIGSVVVDLSGLGTCQEQRRTRFLEGCRAMRTPIILGASFHMANDPPYEAVRINFFMQSDQVLRGVTNILRIVA
jgi:DNA-binding transcriptional MocR family regulator